VFSAKFTGKITAAIPARVRLWAAAIPIIPFGMTLWAIFHSEGLLRVGLFVLAVLILGFSSWCLYSVLRAPEVGSSQMQITPQSVAIAFAEAPSHEVFARTLGTCLDFLRTPPEKMVATPSGIVSPGANGGLTPVPVSDAERARLRDDDIAQVQRAQEELRAQLAAYIAGAKPPISEGNAEPKLLPPESPRESRDGPGG
jgi:hypothetical protein